MDKSWMNLARNSVEYQTGLHGFLQFAFSKSSRAGKILCPCQKCCMGISVSKEEAYEHLTVIGFIRGYTNWIAHGELYEGNTFKTDNISSTNSVNNEMEDMLHDLFPEGSDINETVGETPIIEAANFYKLIEDSQQPLYQGCKKFSKLSFIIHLLHLKCSGKLTNTFFNMLLEFLRDAFPEAMDGLPSSYYEAEKLMKQLGLGYEKYDACVNDCCLYWGIKKDSTSCETCNESRWDVSENDPTGAKRKISRKVVWHFPLKSRLQRLFMSSKTASHMRWHEEERPQDGYMRHPADSPAWKTFDHQHPEFAKDCRNVRLGLASDGFTPFNNMQPPHSTWPVILIPYNLPPWMCMKQPYFMLSLIIPGSSSPGNNIDVYLQPLIKDLNELWDVGVPTYDASRKENFQLRAALMWTISDFPGYAMLSGWSTKGKYACPHCHKFTHSKTLKKWRKTVYMGHRRFLEPNHKFRRDSRSFDGMVEHGRRPPFFTGEMASVELGDIQIKFGKHVKDNPELPYNWKKRSIFFDLPYWKTNVIRHNLDFMHIEKNVTEAIWGTLLDIKEKSKDNYQSRECLRELGIREDLWAVPRDGGKVYLPPGPFTMDKKEKTMFCKVLKDIKVPDGYAGNISRLVQVKPPKISGLKSHDNHILMQQLLPIAIRKTLPKYARHPLIKLSRYFRKLCSKVVDPREVLELEKDIAIILCQLEKYLPPTFFDSMIHLTIHLATEVRLGGPVYYRWMYPIERYLGELKSYVRNKNKPEGSIAQGYVAQECLNFCSHYLADYVETKFNRISRNEAPVQLKIKPHLDVFNEVGCGIGKGKPTVFEQQTLQKAHQYVLFNCDQVAPYREKHLELVKYSHPRDSQHLIERLHSDQFSSWFAKYVQNSHTDNNDPAIEELKWLSKGPDVVGLKFDKYIVNGFRFHTRDIELTRKYQNSGVIVNATTSSFSSIMDRNPITSELVYYGVLKNIIQIAYGSYKVSLFDCDWVSSGRRVKLDVDGFTMVNFSNIQPHFEPFILASQAAQVFYVDDPTESGWKVVVHTSARASYNMELLPEVEMYLQSDLANPEIDVDTETVGWVRNDTDRIEVDVL